MKLELESITNLRVETCPQFLPWTYESGNLTGSAGRGRCLNSISAQPYLPDPSPKQQSSLIIKLFLISLPTWTYFGMPSPQYSF
jgi:hypothetical protein